MRAFPSWPFQARPESERPASLYGDTGDEIVMGHTHTTLVVTDGQPLAAGVKTAEARHGLGSAEAPDAH